MAANYLEQHHNNYSINNSPSAKSGGLGITQTSMRAAANLMQTVLPKINAGLFEKQTSPLTLVKPVTQFVSPRSINQFTNLAKFVESNKKILDDIEAIPRMRESSMKKKDGQGSKIAASSIGFQLNGQQLAKQGQSKSKYSISLNILCIEGIDQSKLDSITSAYLSAGNVGFQIGSNSGLASGGQFGSASIAGPLKSPFKLLKEAEQSETNLEYNGNLQTIYTVK